MVFYDYKKKYSQFFFTGNCMMSSNRVSLLVSASFSGLDFIDSNKESHNSQFRDSREALSWTESRLKTYVPEQKSVLR